MSDLISILKANQHLFELVVPFIPGKNKLIRLDFTKKNIELSDEIINNTRSFCNYINNKLQQENATYGMGGYGEYREVYGRSKVFDGNKLGEEPRRLHLGIDIWGKPATAVMAPLDGIVHSFAFNNRPGDYGTTIILSHQLQGYSFYTLYGHLNLNSIQNLQEGDRIAKGDIFAGFGIPAENGQWPPHLHFQVIDDLQEWNGDYPGVCKYSEREIYLANCPDPDMILQMNRFI